MKKTETINAVLLELSEKQHAALEQAKANRLIILAALRQLNIITVTCNYDGYGDDGQIENPTFHRIPTKGGEPENVTKDVKDRPVAVESEWKPTVSATLETACSDLFYEYLDAHFAGWENNEGGNGLFTWQVGRNELHLIHNQAFTDYQTT